MEGMIYECVWFGLYGLRGEGRRDWVVGRGMGCAQLTPVILVIEIF